MCHLFERNKLQTSTDSRGNGSHHFVKGRISYFDLDVIYITLRGFVWKKEKKRRQYLSVKLTIGNKISEAEVPYLKY